MLSRIAGESLARRAAHVYPNDFAESIGRIKEASGLSWAAFARQLGTPTACEARSAPARCGQVPVAVRYSPATTLKRPLSLRPKTSGKKASSAWAGATKKSPGVVARA